MAWTSATDTTTDTTTDKVVLDPTNFFRYATLRRLPCDVSLRPWVDYYWTVCWDLPAGTTYRSSTLPEPNCHLSIEYGGRIRAGATQDGVFLTGVTSRRRFDVQLTGSGGVAGVRFRPGGLTAMSGIEGWSIRDRVREAQGLLSVNADLIRVRTDSQDLQAVLDETVAALPLRGDAGYDALCASLETLQAAGPGISARDLAAECGLGIRRLQRLYRRFVGVGPHWMIARARVHAALARLHRGQVTTLAELASDLGWFDQAHLNRDFYALVGESPGSYQRRCAADAADGPATAQLPLARDGSAAAPGS